MKKDGTEKIIGEGSEPYASPDGKYIVMTKSEISTREITKNVKVETGLHIISKEMKLLDSIERKDSEISVGRLIADYSGEYAALNHQMKNGDKVRDIAIVYSYESQSRMVLNSIAGQDTAESLSVTFNENGSFDFKNLSFSQYF